MHITRTVYGKWKVYTFPEFREYYVTKLHNSVENEQLELNYLLLITTFSVYAFHFNMFYNEHNLGTEKNLEEISLLLRYILSFIYRDTHEVAKESYPEWSISETKKYFANEVQKSWRVSLVPYTLVG